MKQVYQIQARYGQSPLSSALADGDLLLTSTVQAIHKNDAIVQGCRMGIRLREDLRNKGFYLKAITVLENPLPRVDVDGYLFRETDMHVVFCWHCDGNFSLAEALEVASCGVPVAA